MNARNLQKLGSLLPAMLKLPVGSMAVVGILALAFTATPVGWPVYAVLGAIGTADVVGKIVAGKKSSSTAIADEGKNSNPSINLPGKRPGK